MKAKSDLSSWISQAVAALGPAQAGLLRRLNSHEARVEGVRTAAAAVRLEPASSC
jgi:hypothetical protein